MQPRKIWKCPRVGLTFKRYDQYKEIFWMKDYRCLTYPEKNKKYQIFIILSMLKQGMPVSQIVKETKAKESTVEEMRIAYNQGLKDKTKKSLEFFKPLAEKMKNKDFALAYGHHTRLYENE